MPPQQCFWLNNEGACFHVRTNLASKTRSIRSALRYAGRLTCRLSMMSCWRKRAFSAMSSDLLLPRSAMVPSSNEGVSGLVQRTKRVWSLSTQRRISCLREGRTGFTEKSFSFVKTGRCIMPSCGHMITPFDCTLSHLHPQAVDACPIVLLVIIFRTDISSSQYKPAHVFP
jgi:hypothetical protein